MFNYTVDSALICDNQTGIDANTLLLANCKHNSKLYFNTLLLGRYFHCADRDNKYKNNRYLLCTPRNEFEGLEVGGNSVVIIVIVFKSQPHSLLHSGLVHKVFTKKLYIAMLNF